MGTKTLRKAPRQKKNSLTLDNFQILVDWTLPVHPFSISCNSTFHQGTLNKQDHYVKYN